MDAILIDGKGESRVVGSPMPHSNDIIYKDDEGNWLPIFFMIPKKSEDFGVMCGLDCDSKVDHDTNNNKNNNNSDNKNNSGSNCSFAKFKYESDLLHAFITCNINQIKHFILSWFTWLVLGINCDLRTHLHSFY